MAITTRDGLIAALATQHVFPFYKVIPSSATLGASGLQTASGWTATGTPCLGAGPGTTAATCDRTTVGAIPVPAATGGNTWYLAGFSVHCVGAANVVYLNDRLGHVSGLSGTSTSAQTCNVTLPARATDKTQVLIFLEIYTAVGATASATVTCSYTNESGTSGKTATLSGGIPASSGAAGNLFGPFELASGDAGVTSVQTVTLGTSTGTAGNIGVVLGRYVAQLDALTSNGDQVGIAQLGMPDLGTSPCLWLVGTNSNTTISGAISLCQG